MVNLGPSTESVFTLCSFIFCHEPPLRPRTSSSCSSFRNTSQVLFPRSASRAFWERQYPVFVSVTLMSMAYWSKQAQALGCWSVMFLTCHLFRYVRVSRCWHRLCRLSHANTWHIQASTWRKVESHGLSAHIWCVVEDRGIRQDNLQTWHLGSLKFTNLQNMFASGDSAQLEAGLLQHCWL